MTFMFVYLELPKTQCFIDSTVMAEKRAIAAKSGAALCDL